MADKMTPNELRDYINNYKVYIAQLNLEKDLAMSLNQFTQANVKLSQIRLENEKALVILKENRNDLDEEGIKILDYLLKTQTDIYTQTTKEYEQRRKILNILGDINSSLSVGWKYLMDSDKVIKSTILNLGMSGAKAEMMRSSFENSAQYVARLGGSLEDVKIIMEGYADITGRARVMSEETVKSVMAMGRGTGLGVEEATRLAAQFEFMGKDATSTMKLVQGVVDTSERMGVNTTKVLKDISSNFKKLSTFTFQGGTKAFAQMAIDAERTRLSMETALNVAEATRGLEAVIELGANLQVMGGNFAKIDPLHWLYTVRNEPEKLMNMISDMTKGLFTLRKTSDGTFERFISPADRDRLANVARSLGISNEEMFQMSQRAAEISSMQRDLQRLGLSKEEKELIEGVAQFSSKTGRMYVTIGRTAQDITKLTTEQIRQFASERKLLEDRAKEALTFDETFRATLNELKASLLPMLDWINSAINTLRPVLEAVGNYFNFFSKNLGAFGSILSGAQLLVAALALKAAGRVLSENIKESVARLIKGKKAAAATDLGTQGMIIHPKTGTPMGDTTKTRDVGMARRMQAAGGRNIKTGVGIGAAGLGIGLGIGAGAMGIVELAKAMKDMDVDKIKEMNNTLMVMGGVMLALGIAGKIAGVGMIAFGKGVFLIGAGIGIAAAGIGVAAWGISQIVEASKGAELGGLLKMGLGITAIAGAVALLGNPLTTLGLAKLAAVVGLMAAGTAATAIAANSVAKMGTAMSGTRDDFLAVEKAVAAINSLDRRNTNMFSDLARIMSKPLTIKFADDAILRNIITLDIDKREFMKKVFDVKMAANATVGKSIGKPETT